VTNLVDPEKIEGIVGTRRHARAHFGRAVSYEQQFYILHSQICVEDNEDLRDCVFSQALNLGIDLEVWGSLQDRPVLLQIRGNRLVPAVAGQE
jgi:hypothetical protein